MANLTGTATYQAFVRQLETTDPKHPDTWNPNYQTLINNDAWLKVRADQVDVARGTHPSLVARIQEIEATQEGAGIDYANSEAAALKFALTQAAHANYSVRAFKQQIQQEGEIIIANRGVVTGCTITKSTTAARNLSISAGQCFANGRAYSVSDGVNAASVPSNTGTGSVIVFAYLYQDGAGLWRLAVTTIGEAVPLGAIRIYNVTIPASSTDATDPNLSSVTLTDVRRIERSFPSLLDNPAAVSQSIERLRANDYRVDFDVISAVGAPCPREALVVAGRATNGFTLYLAAAADDVHVRYRVSKLNN